MLRSFLFGESSTISSIDLSSSYNAVDEDNIITVAVLIFCGNWAGAMWWTSATSLLLLSIPAPETGRQLCWNQSSEISSWRYLMIDLGLCWLSPYFQTVVSVVRLI